jgi:hypothetical protein
MRCWRNTSGSGNIGDVDDFKMLKKKVCCNVKCFGGEILEYGWGEVLANGLAQHTQSVDVK